MTHSAHVFLLLGLLASLSASSHAMDGILDRVAKHTAVFTEPPKHVPTTGMPDGPLLGNGGMGVVVAGTPDEQVYWIGKNDFWRRDPGNASILTVGAIRLTIPALTGASYHQEQDMALAEVRSQFTRGANSVKSRSWVDAQENLLVTELKNNGATSLDGSVRQTVGAEGTPGIERPAIDMSHRISRFQRRADSLPGHSRRVSVATRIIGSDSGVGLHFSLQPGDSVTIVSAVVSDLDSTRFEWAAKRQVSLLRTTDVEHLNTKHRKWWATFWSRSFVEIPDQTIESHWYAALYVVACCSRAGQVAPGLWGNWVTTDQPGWHGDFHLNYNFQAPYYIVYSSNHADLSLPFYDALMQSVPNGKKMAKRHGWKGIHFPVCIGPWGLAPEDPDRDWGQRSDAAYAALNFIWQYQYTQDLDFLRRVGYPYLREVGDFWEHYLKLQGGRYVIENDSIHEGSGPDRNGVLSLGLVHTLFKNLISMSEDLNVDEVQRAKWRDIFDRLSPYPVQVRDGKEVFRYSEQGTAWVDGNTLGIQHVFPAGAIGLDSDPRLLEISRNMIDAMARWSDDNGFSSWYTACARLGIDPSLILTKMHGECLHRSMPNLVLTYGGGGIENVAGFLAINEMLMQSHEGIIRFFPDWPQDQDARFGHLRAVGAFLVSAEFKRGDISHVVVTSEKGRDCTVQNPWPEQRVRLIRNAVPAESLQGPRFSFKTKPNESIELQPEKS
ncbi:MAG: hypothetical protein P4L46_18155 [Fimbriimonas sp.]|nr:hypothetical protein [Fimbriimonas sp.]